MSNSQIQAMMMKPLSLFATFNDVPSKGARSRMLAAGAEYRNGRWVRTIHLEGKGEVKGKVASEEEVVRAFEELANIAKRLETMVKA